MQDKCLASFLLLQMDSEYHACVSLVKNQYK